MIITPSVKDIRKEFAHKLIEEDICTDSHGNKVIEIIGANFIADEESIFADVNYAYVNAEIEWYEKQSLNINDIYGGKKEPPKAWKLAADKYGNINSNYGHLIFSEKYHNQYQKVLAELHAHPTSRRASMIYTRPSIWIEYKEGGKSDFICTNSVTYYIRESEIHCVVQMRSNDVVYGYRNDRAWQIFVLRCLADDLGLFPGKICWQVQNLHVYEKHFIHVQNYINKTNE